MIQEKDFLYRVPVKTAPITTPGGQIRNPEILVDVEGGEFMHGNILDANSTNKLVNQSVKEAVDNKIIEGGYVTKDLLEAETTRATEQENSLKTLIDAETSARTKGDEDLSSKIKAEQTRAEGKEKEISDKLAIVNGDSNTEGSFRKAIADVVAAAPEDLDTLKEIADKLAGNDDLHTALNQAITEKADASALLNEVTRATGVENNLKTAIDGKQPKGNYLTEHQSLEEYAKKTDIPEIDTSDFVSKTATDAQAINSTLAIFGGGMEIIDYVANENTVSATLSSSELEFDGCDRSAITLNASDVNSNNKSRIIIEAYNENPIINLQNNIGSDFVFHNYLTITSEGISNADNNANHVFATDGSIADLTQYAKKSELPTVPTKISQLTNDSNFITAADVDFTPYATTQALTAVEQKVTANTTAIEGKQDKGNYITANVVQDTYFGLEKGLKIYNEAANKIMTISHNGIELEANETTISINSSGVFVDSTSDGTLLYSFTPLGIRFAGKTKNDIPTANGSFIDISNYATRDFVTAGLSAKQNKIPVNTIDITNIETADVTKLRTIVTNLINALSSSGLINTVDGVE